MKKENIKAIAEKIIELIVTLFKILQDEKKGELNED